MKFNQENMRIQKILNCMVNDIESPVVQELIRKEIREISNEARRTDPLKKEMLELLKSCLAFVEELKKHGIDEWSDEPRLREAIAKAEEG